MDKQKNIVKNRQLIEQIIKYNYGVFAFPHCDVEVSYRLLSDIHKSGIVSVTFGNQGIFTDSYPRHLQRFSLEKPVFPASEHI